jgi:hypothetical protein
MSASLFRTYLRLIENQDEMVSFFLDVHAENPLRQPLRESRRPRTLMEGPLADKIKATTAQAKKKYNDIQYSLLATLTERALNVFAENPQVSGTLQKILKVGKIGMQNRALIAIMVGMVGTLIGLASNPASAQQASSQIDQVFNGDMDHVIQQLQASGINVEMSGAGIEGLSPEIGQAAKKAAAALKAISEYEFSGDAVMSSNREILTHISIEGTIEHQDTRYVEQITLKTADGKVTLAQISATVENGQFQDSATGVKFELWNEIGKLAPEQQKEVSDYIDGVVTGRSPAAGAGSANPDPSHDLVALIRSKVPEIALLVATAAQSKGGTHVKAGPTGISVT